MDLAAGLFLNNGKLFYRTKKKSKFMYSILKVADQLKTEVERLRGQIKQHIGNMITTYVF